jgi:hypothetical protein
MSKQTTQRFHVERFNLKNLNEIEGKEQCCVEISNTFAALENLDAEVDTELEKLLERIPNSAKECLGYYKLKKHKPCLAKGALKY